MATIITNPVLAWVATIMAGAGVAASSYLTATIAITNAYEVLIPFLAVFTTQSADPIVNIYPTADGTVGYDTSPMSSLSIPRVTGGSSQVSIRIPTGQYVISILNSGPNTTTFYINTQQVLTAYASV